MNYQSINLKNKLLGAIGQAIRKVRKDAGYSQESFSIASGLDRAYVGRVERGETNLSMETLAKIALTLKCNPGILLPDYFQLKKLYKLTNKVK